VGPVVGLTAIRLTEKGIIQFMGYALESGADTYMQFYKKAVRQIRLDKSLVYKPRASDSRGINWGKDLIKVFAGAIIGAIVFLIKKKSGNN